MGERLTASKVFPGVLALLLAAASSLPVAAQDARWRQLTEQASQLRDHGKAAETTPLAQEAVRVAQTTYGPDRPQVALSLNLLGLLLKDQEKFADAETDLRSALAINVKAYGQESRDVATILNNLADLYRVEGKYADGEKLFLQALSVHEKILGPNDPAVAIDVNNLAVLYIAEGKYADAEPLYRRATAIDEKVLAPEDEGLAKDYNNLADLEEKQGKYTDDRALEEVMQRVRSPRIMHIATHGFFLTDQEVIEQSKASGGQHIAIADPMLRSGLFFAGANRIRSGAAPAAGLTDGMLTAYEASQLDLEGTELVVLSACETGLGQQSNGEGVFGLRRGLQEAGADAVLMSMWSVPDRETQELMGLFYANWIGGMEKPEAFRQAQLKERETVRQRYGKDLPFYWGAFVLVSR